MSTPRALVTNDDGIGSAGLRRLAQVAVDCGLDVVVAAPARDTSGASASLTAVEADGRVVTEEVSLDGLDGVPAFAVQAVPGFIALIATRGAFGPPPDVVLSGINLGANTGHAILHSGTVGAAMTACVSGCRALAVSIGIGPAFHWDTAAELAREALEHLLEAPRPVVFNLNVPNVELASLLGLRRGRLADFGAVQTTIAEIGEGYVKVAVADIDADMEAGSDAALIAAGYASITPLEPLCEAVDCDLSWVATVRVPSVAGRRTM